MSFLQRVYDHSPLPFQHFMTSIAGYRQNRSRYGREYWRYRSFLREFDSWSLQRQREYQIEELHRFLQYAVEHSAYYRRLYKGIDLSSIKTIDDLKHLPLLEKEQLRTHIDEIMTIPRKGAVEGHTGGTTGKSLVVRMTPEDMMRRMATLDHFKSRVGFESLQMKRATFNGKHIVPAGQKKKVFWRYNAACKQMIFSSFYLTEENLPAYVEELNRFRPQAIDGFFTSMCDVAGYMERHGISLTFQPLAIFPTSETLTESGRKQLERVFRCRVYNQYASSEGAPFVTECSRQVLHMELHSGIFEHLDGSDEVLVTSFTTHGTPLIRYRIGDSMTFSEAEEDCTCGLHSPTVGRIDGRRLDYLYTAEGAKINAGNVANLFKNMPNALIHAQAVQDTMDSVLIRLEVDSDHYKPEYDRLLTEEFHYKFGEKTQLQIEHVDKIPREKSGKLRMIINRVSEKGS